ncbi:MAG: hypothetical protein ChlgKO_08760 [Chlamydiales bacterium]
MCAVNLTNAFQNLQGEIDKIVEVKTVNDEQAIAYAKELANIGAEYRRELCSSSNKKFKEVLKKAKLQLPIPLKAIKLLSLSELQFHDELKRELSRTTRIFLEFILCQCIVQGRSLYQSDHDKYYCILKEIIKTLPDEEVLTGFELRCCRAAFKNFASMSDRVKKAAEQGTKAMVGGITSTIASARPAPPYVNPAPLLLGAVSVASSVYKQKGELWYLKVFELKMLGFEVGLQTTSHYKMSEHKGKSIKKMLCEHASTSANLAFYICQVFKEIIDNPNIELELKTELFQGKKISILHLAEYRPALDIQNKYWKVRYLAMTYIKELIKTPEYNNEASQAVTIRQMTRGSEKRIVRKKAYQACNHLLTLECGNLQRVLQNILQESEGSLVNEERARRGIESAITRHSVKIASLENQIKSNSRLSEQAAGTPIESKAPTESKEELQKQLDKQKREYVEALDAKEQLSHEVSRREMLQRVLEKEKGSLKELLEEVAAREEGGLDDFTNE